MSVQTFWLERTELAAVGLRRYSNSEPIGGDGYHSALRYISVEPAVYNDEGYLVGPKVDAAHDDPRWPTKCDECSYLFKPEDHWQDWKEQVYERTDTGERRVLHDRAPANELGIPAAEPGASWDAWWMPFKRNPDGIYLMVRLPDGHDWTVDSRASNCTMPDDNEHRCWVRHGDPRECRVTVDKNGLTCAAGAGSIQSARWHGFLRNGLLA